MSDVEEGIDALLMDGRIVHVRPVSEGDTEALSALYTRASPRSRYLRFFSAGVSVDREVQRLVTRAMIMWRWSPNTTGSPSALPRMRS